MLRSSPRPERDHDHPRDKYSHRPIAVTKKHRPRVRQPWNGNYAHVLHSGWNRSDHFATPRIKDRRNAGQSRTNQITPRFDRTHARAGFMLMIFQNVAEPGVVRQVHQKIRRRPGPAHRVAHQIREETFVTNQRLQISRALHVAASFP